MQTSSTRLAAAAVVVVLAQVGLAGASPGLPETAAGTVTLVQGVPGGAVDVRVDGRLLHRVARTGDVIGPVRLPAGRHVFAFVAPDGDVVRSAVWLGPDASVDVVLHRPAAVRGASVVTPFRTPTRPLRAGRARIVVAATATLAPADVRVDDRVVFTNIANGESAAADVTAGRHRVALVPSGQGAPALLGPLEVTVAAGTVTTVYVSGGPPDGAPRPIVHTVALGSGGQVSPGTVRTGTVGLARDRAVRVFGPE